MRRKWLCVTMVTALLLVPGITGATGTEDRATATAGSAATEAVMSENISLLTTLPNPGTIGARFRGKYMYLTTLTGLTIYDVSDPKAPAETGRLVLPHFQNEDVDLGGDILLISNDAAESTGILYVIDISDPSDPKLRSTLEMGGNPVEGGPGHTASCVLKCKFVWVTDGGGIRVVDLRDPDAPVLLDKHGTPAGESADGAEIATHDVQVDGNGLYWVVGFGGAAAYKVGARYQGKGLGKLVARTGEEGFSTYFDELGLGDGGKPNDYVLHNSHRRKNDNVIFVTEEDYTRPGCDGAGALTSWRVPLKKAKKKQQKGMPNGKDLKPLDMWVTEQLRQPETWQESPTSAPVSAVCSAHYFDLKGNLVAHGWYEQGLRVIDVSNPKKMRQVGYFILPQALVWAAYFPPTDKTASTIYVLDGTNGVNVLEIARPDKGRTSMPRVACKKQKCEKKHKMPALTAPVDPAWKTYEPGVTLPGLEKSSTFGYACRLTSPEPPLPDSPLPDSPLPELPLP